MDRNAFPTGDQTCAAALRSQLNQMAAASQVLEGSTQGEKGRAYLAILNQGICRMLRIVGRMELGGRLSALEGGGYEPGLTDLAPALETMCRRLEGILADIGVTFTFRQPAALPLRGEAELICQMLLELVAHAALSAAEIHLDAAKKDGKVYFTVSDRGPGPANGRPELPAPVEQEEEETSIALARAIAALHGGSLMTAPAAGGRLSLAVSLPGEAVALPGRMESPSAAVHPGGFDPVLVAMSQLLPARSFRPENLG